MRVGVEVLRWVTHRHWLMMLWLLLVSLHLLMMLLVV
jgi:hypothetical protein